MWNLAWRRRSKKKLFCKLFHKLNPIFHQSTLSNQLPFHHVQYKIWISICQIFGGANKIMVWGNWINASKVKLNFKPGRGYLINCRKLSSKITFFTGHNARGSTLVQNPTEIWHQCTHLGLLWTFIKILKVAPSLACKMWFWDKELLGVRPLSLVCCWPTLAFPLWLSDHQVFTPPY